MKKMGMTMNVLMGVTMSIALSLVGTLGSGHFTVPTWLASFGISLVISLVIGILVPIKKVSDNACAKANLPLNTVKARLLSALVSDMVYTPIITIIMVSLMLTGATRSIDAQIVEKNSEIAETQATLSTLTQQLGDVQTKLETGTPEETSDLKAQEGELNGQIAGLTEKMNGLNGAVQGMEAAKPPFVPALIKSLILTIVIGYILIFIIQPVYIKLLMKKFKLQD